MSKPIDLSAADLRLLAAAGLRIAGLVQDPARKVSLAAAADRAARRAERGPLYDISAPASAAMRPVEWPRLSDYLPRGMKRDV